MTQQMRIGRRLGAMTAAGLLAAGLAACAPEPDENGAPPENPDKNGSAHAESSWGEPDPDDEAKQTELPAGFPDREFFLPEGAVIDDAGERSETSWFLVLRAADADEAERQWEEVITVADFDISDLERGEAGELSATLRKGDLDVSALTLPQEDGSVLLNYELQRAP